MEESLTNNTDAIVNDKVSTVDLVPQWCRTFHITFMAIVFVTGLPGNIIVIRVQSKNKRKSSTDWFITFLAVADVMSLTVCVPIYFIVMTQQWSSIGTTFGCRFKHFAIQYTAVAPNIIIAFIAVDRLWKSKSVQQLLTPDRAFYSGLVAFAVSILIGTPAAFTTRINAFGQCVYDESKSSLRTTVYVLLATVAVVSCFVIVYSYVRIVVILKDRVTLYREPSSVATVSHHTVASSFPTGRYGKALRTTKLMFLVTAVFMLSQIIPATAALVKAIVKDRTNTTLMIVVFLLNKLYLINNCANPVFYFCLNTKFRKEVIEIFKCN